MGNLCCTQSESSQRIAPLSEEQITLREPTTDIEFDAQEEDCQKMISFKNFKGFKSIEDIEKYYQIISELGSGSFGQVYRCKKLKTNFEYAVKKISKDKLIKEGGKDQLLMKLMENELTVLEKTDHPHITRVFEIMEDKSNYWIVMEIMEGGDLLGRITQIQFYGEKQTAQIVHQVMLALNYMHKQNIVHRDIKLENLLCKSKSKDDLGVKLTDFGFSTFFDPKNGMNEVMGSPLYMSPELHNFDNKKQGTYDNRVDVWSLGVLTYILLSGEVPFDTTNSDLEKAIIDNKIKFDENKWKIISKSARKFVDKCLQYDYKKRPQIEELLSDPWIADWVQNPKIQPESILEVTDALISFRKTGVLQSGVLSFLTNLTATQAELDELTKIFESLDTSKNGTLSLDELKAGLRKPMGSFYFKENHWDQILVSLDSNQDGVIDFSEFISAAYSRSKLINKNNLQTAFKIFDLNGDGQITNSELKQVFSGGNQSELIQKFGKVWQEIIAEVDQNNDGQINFQEFEDAMNKVLDQRSTFFKKIKK